MRIGIATFHRSHNYGALLQAIALRFVIEQCGHKCSFIDYWPLYHKKMYNVLSRSKFKDLGFKYLWEFFYRLKRYFSFEKFIAKYINPFCSDTKEIYDVVVYGSDQIWRKQPNLNDYDPFYFGKNSLKTQRHVSYAASMGTLSFDERDTCTIKKLLCNLDAISVREIDLLNYVQNLSSKHVSLSLDPTLLLGRDDWNKVFPQKKIEKEKYVLYYDLLEGSFDEREILRFSQKRNLKVIRISGVAEKKALFFNKIFSNPEEFLNLINNAEFVFTSSFHGVVFSIIFNKRFYASFSKNGTRAESLLKNVGLSSHLIPVQKSLPEIYDDIDYEKVNEKLFYMRQDSLKSLHKIICL